MSFPPRLCKTPFLWAPMTVCAAAQRTTEPVLAGGEGRWRVGRSCCRGRAQAGGPDHLGWNLNSLGDPHGVLPTPPLPPKFLEVHVKCA